MSDIQDLIPSVAIDKLLAARKLCDLHIGEIFSLMRQCDDLLAEHRVGEGSCFANELFSAAVSNALGRRGLGVCPSTQPRVVKAISKRIDAALWACVLSRSGMRTHLSATLRADWDKACQEAETVPFEYDYLAGTFGDFMERRGELFADAVVEVFRRLSWTYKTNSPVAFGKRLFLSHMHTNGLDDLERAMHVLDDKPPPDHRVSIGQNFRYSDGRKLVETDYLAVQSYKKGSAKVTFARMDLVDQMNRILFKRYPGALPPPARGGNYRRE